MVLISHEVPKQLFPYHDLISDYPYVLAHLLKRDDAYLKFYQQRCLEASYSILDNSAFELGHPIEIEELVECIEMVKPTHVVLPDVLHRMHQTLRLAHIYIKQYPQELERYIGVVQGECETELFMCVDQYLELGIKLIAVPFDLLPAGEGFVKHSRYLFIDKLVSRGYTGFKLHLLGCDNPVEFLAYKKRHKDLIHSVDTSSPIIRGWNGNLLTPFGAEGEKPKDKLAENLDKVIHPGALACIIDNCRTFRLYLED